MLHTSQSCYCQTLQKTTRSRRTNRWKGCRHVGAKSVAGAQTGHSKERQSDRTRIGGSFAPEGTQDLQRPDKKCRHVLLTGPIESTRIPLRAAALSLRDLRLHLLLHFHLLLLLFTLAIAAGRLTTGESGPCGRCARLESVYERLLTQHAQRRRKRARASHGIGPDANPHSSRVHMYLQHTHTSPSCCCRPSRPPPPPSPPPSHPPPRFRCRWCSRSPTRRKTR